MVTHTHEISREDKTHGNLCNAHHSLGDFKTSIDDYERHLKFAKELGDRLREANAYGDLGDAHFSLGNLKTAMDYYERLLKIAKELGN